MFHLQYAYLKLEDNGKIQGEKEKEKEKKTTAAS